MKAKSRRVKKQLCATRWNLIKGGIERWHIQKEEMEIHFYSSTPSIKPMPMLDHQELSSIQQRVSKYPPNKEVRETK